MRSRAVSRCAALAFAASLSQGAKADPVEDFYRGKQIEFVIATEPGTTYDSWVRLLSRHMPRFMPGAPAFIPKNMPGAGQIRAATHIYSLAAKDGTSIGTFSRNLATASLMKSEAVKFDIARFQWIGSTDISNRICVVDVRSPVRKADDLFRRETTFGGAGAGSGSSAAPLLVAALLQMRMRLIEGY